MCYSSSDSHEVEPESIEEVEVLEPGTDNAAPAAEPDVQHKQVQVLNGSKDDVIFIIYDEIKKDELKDLYIILQRQRIVWVRSSANIPLRSLKEHLLLAFPDITLVNPTFSANNTLIDMGKHIYIDMGISNSLLTKTDRRTDRRTDRQMDKRTDGQMDRQITDGIDR